jgi:zinc protease
MKRIFVFSLLILMIAGALPAQNVSIPEYRREILDNGLVVLLMEYHKLPLIELRLAVRGGYSYDPAGYEGLADLTATLLRKGTEKRSATQIAEEIDFVGGSLSTGASRDFFVVSAEVLKKDLGMGVDLFSDVILHPVFAAEELDRERRQSLAELEDAKDDPGSIASIYFNKVIYQKHPYGHQSSGTKLSLPKISDKEVKEFYRSVFIPNASVLTIVGDFSSKDMLALVKNTFSSWKKKSPMKIQFPSMQVHKGRRLVVVNKSHRLRSASGIPALPEIIPTTLPFRWRTVFWETVLHHAWWMRFG